MQRLKILFRLTMRSKRKFARLHQDPVLSQVPFLLTSIPSPSPSTQLLKRPFFSLNHHSKFVVKVLYSPSGQYLASAGYDGKVMIYKRFINILTSNSSTFTLNSDPSSTQASADPEDTITGDLLPLNSKVEYRKLFEIKMKFNPENLRFIRCEKGIVDESRNWERVRGGKEGVGEFKDEEVEQDEDTSGAFRDGKRTYLVFTIRNDCHLHYIPLPLNADNGSSSNGNSKVESDLVSNLQNLNLSHSTDSNKSPKLIIPPSFKLLSFNINPSPYDLHVSFSLLSLSLHPSTNYLSLQTGDHSLNPTTSTSQKSSISTFSKILIFPLLSGERVKTIFTEVESSSYLIPRHCWLKGGRSVWINSEDGIVRCISVDGKERGRVVCHGRKEKGVDMEVEGEESEDGGLNESHSWSRGAGGNTIVKDLVVWVDEDQDGDRDRKGSQERIVSVGFDRTARVVGVPN